jgi:hypothetical protein
MSKGEPSRPPLGIGYSRDWLLAIASVYFTGIMTCAYGVPFHITYGPPLV